MHMRDNHSRGFTIIELLVVISIISLLIGILLPAVGKARDNARVSVSKSNLRQMSVANHSYAADWSDRHLTLVRDNLAAYGSVSNYNNQVYGPPNQPLVPDRFEVHPPILFGYGSDGGLYAYPMDQTGYHWALSPIGFPGGGGNEAPYFGWFRFPNTKPLHTYVGGKYYDSIFWAPKDRIYLASAEPCMDDPGEVAIAGSADLPWQLVRNCLFPAWPTYCYSPAALYNPQVLSKNPTTDLYFTDPWDLPTGFRVPNMSQIRFPTLKTHMLEHQWLQGTQVDCNAAFDPTFSSAVRFIIENDFFNGRILGLDGGLKL